MVQSREPAGNTATTDPRSQRIQASRRGGQITARGSPPMVQESAYPHSRAPGAPYPGWSHHSLARWVSRYRDTEAITTVYGQAERIDRTAKTQLSRRSATVTLRASRLMGSAPSRRTRRADHLVAVAIVRDITDHLLNPTPKRRVLWWCQPANDVINKPQPKIGVDPR